MDDKFQTIEHSSLEVRMQHQWISFSLSVFYLILIFLKLRIISLVCGFRQYGCLTKIKCLFSSHGRNYHFSTIIFIASKQTLPIRNIGATQLSYLIFLYQIKFCLVVIGDTGCARDQARFRMLIWDLKLFITGVNIVPKHWNLIKNKKKTSWNSRIRVNT